MTTRIPFLFIFIPTATVALLFYFKFFTRRPPIAQSTQTPDWDSPDEPKTSQKIFEEKRLNQFLIDIKESVVNQIIKTRQDRRYCFISYAWPPNFDKIAQNTLHQKIRRLVIILEALGFVVVYDRNDIGAMPHQQWMETQIKQADFILLIGTLDLKRKVTQTPLGNIGFEYQKIIAKLSQSPHCLIPILIEGTLEKSFPDKIPSVARDCSGEKSYYNGLFAINPVGVIPALLGLIPSESRSAASFDQHGELCRTYAKIFNVFNQELQAAGKLFSFRSAASSSHLAVLTPQQSSTLQLQRESPKRRTTL